MLGHRTHLAQPLLPSKLSSPMTKQGITGVEATAEGVTTTSRISQGASELLERSEV